MAASENSVEEEAGGELARGYFGSQLHLNLRGQRRYSRQERYRNLGEGVSGPRNAGCHQIRRVSESMSISQGLLGIINA